MFFGLPPPSRSLPPLQPYFPLDGATVYFISRNDVYFVASARRVTPRAFTAAAATASTAATAAHSG